MAEALGWPLMGWQRYVADVAGEIDPATGLFAYAAVGLTVPRQSGKTTLTDSLGGGLSANIFMLHRSKQLVDTVLKFAKKEQLTVITVE